MVTHLPIASCDTVSVESSFDRSIVVVATGLLAAAAATAAADSVGGVAGVGSGCGVAVRAARTGSAVLPGAAGLRRRVRVLGNHATAVVMVLLRRHGGDRGAAVGAVRLRYVVGVLRDRVGAVVDVLLGGFRGSAAAVRAVRLGMVVVVTVWSAGAELSGVGCSGGHDDLQRRHKQ